MTVDQISVGKWSSRKWRLYALSIFALQFIALFFLSDRRPSSVRYAPKRTSFYFVGEPERTGPMAENLSLNDPTLFALPNLRGFSGPAWLRPLQFDYRFTNWNEEPRWLELSDVGLTSTYTQAYSNELTEVLPKRSLVPFEKPALTPSPDQPESQFWIVGSLRFRPILTPLMVPLQYYSEVLSNSVVQLGVDDGGNPISARLLRGSGWKRADDEALRLSQRLRFRALPGYDRAGASPRADLDWGIIVYQWFTLNPTQTNHPPGNP